MPTNLALIDLISPYVLRSKDIGPWRPVLATMFVDEHHHVADDAGVVVEGVARFSGDSLPFFDPKNAILGGTPFADPPPANPPATEPLHPKDDPNRRDPWFDLQDAHIDFRFVAPRHASQIVATGLGGVPTTGALAPVAAVLAALDQTPTDAPPSDYPSTAFTLDMLLTTVVLRPPFLHGARLDTDGVLVPDPEHDRVGLRMPRLKLRLSQGSNPGDQLILDLLSAGAAGLDDPADIATAELVTMDPPYAFIGTSNVVGFGFRSATLDLSDGVTPPAVLEKFGFDESWTGVYLPEVRLFVAPKGLRGLALDAGARDLLIGVGAHAGVSGDFELDVIRTGGPPHVGARFLAADGQSYGITTLDQASAIAYLPDRTTMVVDIDGGREPVAVSVGFGADPTPASGRVHDVDLRDAPAGRGPTMNLFVKATDSSTPPVVTEYRISAVRRGIPAPPDPAAVPAAPVPPASVTTTSITGEGSTATRPALAVAGQTDTTVTLTLDPTDEHTRWATPGTPMTGESATFAVDLTAGQSTTVTAQRPAYSGGEKLTCYFLPDHPAPDEEGGLAASNYGYSQNQANTHTTPAVDGDQPTGFEPGGTDVLTAIAPVLDRLDAGTSLPVEGFDDRGDGGSDSTYLESLSMRRALGFCALIEKAYPGKFHFVPSAHAGPTGTPATRRNRDWRAEATVPLTAMPPNTVGTTTVGTLVRPPIVTPPAPPKPRDEAPPAPPPPSWFHSAGVKVRLVRDTFVAVEIHGRIDYQTAAEQALRNSDPGITELPEFRALGANTADGIVDFRVLVSIDDASQQVTVDAQLGADPADKDGLFLTGSLPGANNPAPRNFGRDVLGLFALFTPLLSSVAPSSPLDGDIAPLAISAAVSGVPFALAGLDLLKVERVVLYGGELVVKERAGGPEVSLLFDIETAISADFKLGGTTILKIPEDSPIVVRYKAIGLRLGYTPPEPRFAFRPVFDASKGYTVDVSKPGAIQAPGPLGEILQVLAARLARTNPLTLDVDMGMKVDLGVISVDRLAIRVPLQEGGSVQLGALGVGVDIPGVLRGRGYLEIKDTGTPGKPNHVIAGGIDLTLLPVKLRVAAGLRLEHIPADGAKPEVTAVIATIEVDFPVAIPLASSGLGIYGFLGLFAMHYSRDEGALPAGHLTPALAWLQATGGDPTNLQHWKADRDRWAFGVGALLGTMEGGTLINLKGMLLVELPGPRILLFCKARLIQAKPTLKSNAEGNLLAVIDIDAERGTLTVGLVADYTVDPVLKVRIPVEAFFNFEEGTDWHLYLGRYDDPVQAKILEIFDGSAYLMISGNGIEAHKNLPAVSGFAIALGVHASILWGSTAAGLYLKVAADLDVTVGFTPFHLAGIMSLRGELRLFIISISASARLDVDIARLPAAPGQTAETTAYLIKGEVCGEIDLFFFTLKGCVHFEVGSAQQLPGPTPPPLINGLSLMSRTPALVVGTATDRPVDGSLGSAVESAGQPAAGTLPVVPVDVIPVLLMSSPPVVDDPHPSTDPLSPTALTVLGNRQAEPAAGAPQGGFVSRGADLFRYDLKSVELIGPVGDGATPATWWTLKAPGKDNVNAALALLSWVPTPAPNAIERSLELDRAVTDRWGEACLPVAPPASVFHTFAGQDLGSAPDGWTLHGAAWPDPPGSKRSAPPTVTLRLTERWRSGNDLADGLRGVLPATVDQLPVPCPTATPAVTAPATAASADGPTATAAGQSSASATLQSIVAAAAAGQPVGRADFGPLLVGPPTSASPAPTGLGCTLRALASPRYDKLDIGPLGRTGWDDVLHALWQQAGYTPGPLCAALTLQTGRVAHAVVLVAVFTRAAPDIRAAVVDSHGNVQDSLAGTVVRSPGDLPAAWLDAAGPARSTILGLFDPQVQQGVLGGYTLKRFDVFDHGPAMDHIELGIVRDTDEYRLPSPVYLVIGMELLGRTETERFDYDTSASSLEKTVLAGALGPDSSTAALLQPGTTYQVRASWTAVSAKRKGEKVTDVQPVPAPGATLPTVTQSFWFRTDAAPPARLDPWVLNTNPADGEQHVFTGDQIRIAFATTDVMRLHATYGSTLQVRLRAASFRTPDMNGGGIPHPFPVGQTTTQTSGGILTPWEETVERLLSGQCIPFDFQRARHSTASIPLPLDPLTEYVMDIERVPLSGAGDPVRVFRRTFTTSAFTSIDDYAATLRSVRIVHRPIAPGALQQVGTRFAAADPAGSQLDDALREAGLEPMPVPDFPRVVVFWQQSGGTPPEPAAVLIDGTEPMWRSRAVPRAVPPPPDRTERWEQIDTPWLRLEPGTDGDPIVDRVVPGPGGQRALITLTAPARDRRLVLALRQTAFTDTFLDGPQATDRTAVAVDLNLGRAPWEES